MNNTSYSINNSDCLSAAKWHPSTQVSVMLCGTTSIRDHAAEVNVGYLNIPGYSRDYLFFFYPCQNKTRRVASKETRLLNCKCILQWSLKDSELVKWLSRNFNCLTAVANVLLSPVSCSAFFANTIKHSLTPYLRWSTGRITSFSQEFPKPAPLPPTVNDNNSW